MQGPSVYCLHGADQERLLARIDEVREHVDFFAIGMDLHMEEPDTVAFLRDRGLRAYAHFLYYDIREVVVNAAVGLAEHGYAAFDMHALCGIETMQAVCNEVHARGLEVLTFACALLPNQIDLPWWPHAATLDEAGNFAAEKARQAWSAGVDGILTARQVAGHVARGVPAGKSLLVYADRASINEGWPTEWGPFYDWHADDIWEQNEGIGVIQARRLRS